MYLGKYYYICGNLFKWSDSALGKFQRPTSGAGRLAFLVPLYTWARQPQCYQFLQPAPPGGSTRCNICRHPWQASERRKKLPRYSLSLHHTSEDIPQKRERLNTIIPGELSRPSGSAPDLLTRYRTLNKYP